MPTPLHSPKGVPGRAEISIGFKWRLLPREGEKREGLDLRLFIFMKRWGDIGGSWCVRERFFIVWMRVMSDDYSGGRERNTHTYKIHFSNEFSQGVRARRRRGIWQQ